MKIKISSLVFLFLITNCALGQVKFRVKKLNADSLLALIPEKENSELVDVLNLLSNVICRKDIDSSISLAKEAIVLSDKLEYQKGLADGYFNVGNGYFLLDSLQPTISNYLKALRIYEDIGPSEEYGNLCSQSGLLDYFAGRFDKIPNYGKLALQIYEKINDSAGQSMIYLGLGASKILINQDWDSANYYTDKALSFLNPAIAQNEAAMIYNEKGHLYHNQYYESRDTAHFNKALYWFFKGLELPELYDEMKAKLYLNLGATYISNNTEKSIATGVEYFQEVDEIADSCYDAFAYKAIVSNILAWGNYEDGDFDEAINLFKKSIRVIEKRTSNFSVNAYREPVLAYNWKYYHKVYKQSSYEGLYNTYFKLGDYKQALEYYALSRDAKEEIYLENNQKLITMLEAISEDEKIDKQFSLLISDNELKEVKIKQSRIYLFALAGFILILVLVVLLFFRQRKIRAEHKTFVREQKLLHDLELKNIESKKLKELDHLKSRFFANISHEFRTPLTLIKGPLEKALSQSKDKNQIKELGIAKKYTSKLQTLINNLLAISKLESGKMELHASEMDIVKMVHTYIQSFESLAKQKNIELKFISENKEIKAYIDRGKFEQVLNNLLSNAFKFTGDGEKVQVVVGSKQYAKSTQLASSKIANCQLPTADSEVQWAEIKITDTGRGIAPEHISHVFDRFYQVENTDNNYHEGTGIGLALSKELVELHYGKITVESKVDEGTTFTIILPLGKDHLDPNEIFKEKPVTSKPSQFEPEINQTEKVFVSDNHTEDDDTSPVLLIVEDNADMRSYIREYFELEYQVIEAVDGLDGYEKSIEYIPDIIISDVMMPGMDGVGFCRKVKMDERTSHIPVILLTARASKESRIEGLETGADDFITKPFDGDELQVRVKNLIEQRKRLSIKLESEIWKGTNYAKFNFEGSEINSMDEKFLQKVIKIVNEQYSDPEFNTKVFSMTIGHSRVQLHRKIKALTGQSTGDFIRTYRLTRAAEFIKKESGNIAEIAYDVGFNSPSYFSECFKNHFGKLPSEFNGGAKKTLE